MSDRPRVEVEPPRAWVLAEHFSPEEIAELNQFCANRDESGLARYLDHKYADRHFGIAPSTLFEFLRERYMTDQVECPCCGEMGYDDPGACSFCADAGHDHF